MTRFVVVGAGQSGYAAATTLRRLAMDAHVTLIGEERHAPYERPPLSKGVMAADVLLPPYFLPPAEYEARRIELLLGSGAAAINAKKRCVILSNGSEVDYDSLLLTTGGRPRELDCPGSEHALYLRTFEDALAIRHQLREGSRVVCVGAGVIGLELAATARSLGASVTVVEAGAACMVRMVPPPVRTFVQRLHERRGVRLRFGLTVTAVHRQASELLIELSDGSQLKADTLVAGVGLRRNIELAASAGIAVADGIVVDEYGATGTEGIFAAGDVAAFWHPQLNRHVLLESWYHALDHAVAVASGLAGDRQPYAPVPRFWTDQYDATVHAIGDFRDAVSVVVTGAPEQKRYGLKFFSADDALVFAATINDPRLTRPLMKAVAAREQASLDERRNARPIADCDPIAVW